MQIFAAVLTVAVAIAPPVDTTRPGPLASTTTTFAVEANAAPTSAEQAWTSEPSAASDEVEHPAAPRRPLADAARWQVRDRRLVITSAVSGAVFGVSAIAAIVLGVEIRKSIDRCSYATYTQCDATHDRVMRLRTPAFAVAGLVGASFVALLVSSIMLGVHRSRRPDIAKRGTSRFALSSSGFRLRF